MGDFWRFARMESGEPARLYVEGEIWPESPWWMEDGQIAAPDSFRREMMALGDGPLDVYVNSPGGDAAAGVAMATLLRQHKGHTRCIITSLAASAASLLPCGCDEVQMGPGALLMIHNPSTCAYGDHREMDRAKAYLDKLKDAVICLYGEKCGKAPDAIARMMDEETFMTAQDAIREGFCDAILERPLKAASMVWSYQRVEAMKQKAAQLTAGEDASRERAEMLEWLENF